MLFQRLSSLTQTWMTELHFEPLDREVLLFTILQILRRSEIQVIMFTNDHK